jgi:hypothetical protein
MLILTIALLLVQVVDPGVPPAEAGLAVHASHQAALGAVPAVQPGRHAGPRTPAAGDRIVGDPSVTIWTLRVSGGLHQMRDDLLVPLRYVGPALDLGLLREQVRPGSGTDLELGAGVAYGLNRYRHHGAALWFAGTLRHGWELPREGWGPEWNVRLGLAALARTDDFYFFDWDDAHLYWTATYGLGPSLVLERRLGDGRRLLASADVPLVGFVGRPDAHRRNKVDDLVFLRTWLLEPSRGLAFALPPEALMLDARLRYRASDRMHYAWGFAFRTVRDPHRSVLLKQTVGVEWSPWR